MPVQGKAPVVQLIKAQPTLEDKAKLLLEGKLITHVRLRDEFLTLYLESGLRFELNVFFGFKEQ